jgi:hypothetical protein
MVAHVRPPSGTSLRITFSRRGEGDEQRVADDGNCAVSVAMRLLALKEELRPGDALTVAENRPANPQSGHPPVRIADD